MYVRVYHEYYIKDTFSFNNCTCFLFCTYAVYSCLWHIMLRSSTTTHYIHITLDRQNQAFPCHPSSLVPYIDAWRLDEQVERTFDCTHGNAVVDTLATITTCPRQQETSAMMVLCSDQCYDLLAFNQHMKEEYRKIPPSSASYNTILIGTYFNSMIPRKSSKYQSIASLTNPFTTISGVLRDHDNTLHPWIKNNEPATVFTDGMDIQNVVLFSNTNMTNSTYISSTA